MTVTMVVPARPVRVAMTTENEEADEVGQEAGRANDEHKLGVVDLGRLNESGQGFEDDRDAEGDEENGIEEGTQDFGAHPLQFGQL